MNRWQTHAMPEKLSFPELCFQISAIPARLFHFSSQIRLRRLASFQNDPRRGFVTLLKDVADTGQPSNRLATIRKARGVTQIDLSARLGITQSMLSKYERGDLRLHGAMLARLSEILSVSTDELLGVHVTPLATPPALKDKRLRHRIHQIDRLSKRDREALIRTIDAFIGRAEIADNDSDSRRKAG
jgi:transcriptional regulator with XRE-family HTH domain